MKAGIWFCGAGLSARGLERAGIEISYGIDLDPVACESFKENFPEAEVFQTDIRGFRWLAIPKVDVITGSPPCQGFSRANAKRDKDPELIWFFLYAMAQLKPKYWVMEQVPDAAQALPPNVHYKILKASCFGARHRRARLFAGRFPAPFSTGIAQETIGTPTARLGRGRGWNRCYHDEFVKQKGRRPEVEDVLIDMGCPELKVMGNKKQRMAQVGNGAYVPIFEEIGKRIMEAESRKRSVI